MIDVYKQESAEDIDWEFNEDDKFWIPVKRYNEEKDVYAGAGSIQCSCSIMPLTVAEKSI